MRLRGHQLDGFNAALKSGDESKAQQELQAACARADGIVPFASASGSAALLEILKVCEEYQNADFEGKGLEHQCDEGYRCSMKVITIASAALQELGAQKVRDIIMVCRSEIERLQKFEQRMKWLHDCSNGSLDSDGYEWGIYRVKWENGRAVKVWQTNSDFSDLDAEMAKPQNAALCDGTVENPKR